MEPERPVIAASGLPMIIPPGLLPPVYFQMDILQRKVSINGFSRHQRQVPGGGVTGEQDESGQDQNLVCLKTGDLHSVDIITFSQQLPHGDAPILLEQFSSMFSCS